MAELAKWAWYADSKDIEKREAEGWVRGEFYKHAGDGIEAYVILWHHDHDPPNVRNDR